MENKPKEELGVLLKQVQETGNRLEDIVNMFMPLIKSYDRKTYNQLAKEDLSSILTLCLIETVRSMKISDRDGENVNYIRKVLHFKHIETIRKVNKIQSTEEFTLENQIEHGLEDEVNLVFEDMISKLSESRQKLIRLKYKDMLTDAEIASLMGKSRQAVHKQLLKTYSQLLAEYHP